MSRNTGAANFDISATGDLAYVPGRVAGGSRRLWVDRKGNAERVPLPPRSYLDPRIPVLRASSTLPHAGPMGRDADSSVFDERHREHVMAP
jgi:hypothetical protein